MRQSLPFVICYRIINAIPGFDAIQVFRVLHKPACLRALSEHYNKTASFSINLCIATYIKTFFSEIELQIKSSAKLHQDNLGSRCSKWRRLKSNRTCLYCLRRKPEHVLNCGHAIDDTCIKIFGKGLNGGEHWFQVSNCLLYASQGSLSVQLKPSTAGFRLMSIDGGGTQGIIPLEFLKLLQEAIYIPLQDLFDLAIGTSSGES